MTSFRYDVGKFNSQNENLNMNVSKYKSLCEQLFIKAKSIKNVWNDRTSDEFYNIAQADELKVNEIFESLEENKKNFEYFGSELSNIFSARGYATHDLIVEYNSSKINLAYNYLDVVKRHIKNAEKAFNDCVIPCDYANLPALNEVFNALFNDIEAYANEMDWKLNDTFQKVETLVANNRTKNLNSPFVAMNDKLYYISTTPVPNTIPNFEISRNEMNANSVNYSGTIDDFKNETEINTTNGNINIDIQTINEIDTSDVVENDANGIVSNSANTINTIEYKDDSNTASGILKTGSSEIDSMEDTDDSNTVAGLVGDYASKIEVEESNIETNEVRVGELDVVKKIDGFDMSKKDDSEKVTYKDKDVVGTLNHGDLDIKSNSIDSKQVDATSSISSINMDVSSTKMSADQINSTVEVSPMVNTDISSNANTINFDFDTVSSNIDTVKPTEIKTRNIDVEDILNNEQ